MLKILEYCQHYSCLIRIVPLFVICEKRLIVPRACPWWGTVLKILEYCTLAWSLCYFRLWKEAYWPWSLYLSMYGPENTWILLALLLFYLFPCYFRHLRKVVYAGACPWRSAVLKILKYCQYYSCFICFRTIFVLCEKWFITLYPWWNTVLEKLENCNVINIDGN